MDPQESPLPDSTQLSVTLRDGSTQLSEVKTAAALPPQEDKTEVRRSDQNEVQRSSARAPKEKTKKSKVTFNLDNVMHDFPLPEEPTKAPLIPRGKSKSRRVKYVKPWEAPEESVEDTTIKGEGKFLKNLEKHKGKRLVRICYCKPTCWLKFKECAIATSELMYKYLRAFGIICCPPFCLIPNRAAFWPPSRAYFFFRGPENLKKLDEEGENYANLVSERKKLYVKLKQANKEAIGGIWRVGISHRCGGDVENAEGFVLETENFNYIACVKVACPKGAPRFAIIYSHPSGSDLSDHLIGMPNLEDMARFYRSDVYSYDYSGYGVSSGSPTEDNQNKDIKALYKYVTEKQHVSPSKIVVMGFSIGTCASVDLVMSRDEPVAGLILEAPPTSIMRVILWNRGCFKQPWKEDTCCADKFSTFDKIGNVTVPVLVIHGTKDTMVPIQHGQEVFRRTQKKVPPLWLGADHDNLENFSEVWKRIRTFLREEKSTNISIDETQRVSKNGPN